MWIGQLSPYSAYSVICEGAVTITDLTGFCSLLQCAEVDAVVSEQDFVIISQDLRLHKSVPGYTYRS